MSNEIQEKDQYSKDNARWIKNYVKYNLEEDLKNHSVFFHDLSSLYNVKDYRDNELSFADNPKTLLESFFENVSTTPAKENGARPTIENVSGSNIIFFVGNANGEDELFTRWLLNRLSKVNGFGKFFISDIYSRNNDIPTYDLFDLGFTDNERNFRISELFNNKNCEFRRPCGKLVMLSLSYLFEIINIPFSASIIDEDNNVSEINCEHISFAIFNLFKLFRSSIDKDISNKLSKLNVEVYYQSDNTNKNLDCYFDSCFGTKIAYSSLRKFSKKLSNQYLKNIRHHLEDSSIKGKFETVALQRRDLNTFAATPSGFLKYSEGQDAINCANGHTVKSFLDFLFNSGSMSIPIKVFDVKNLKIKSAVFDSNLKMDTSCLYNFNRCCFTANYFVTMFQSFPLISSNRMDDYGNYVPAVFGSVISRILDFKLLNKSNKEIEEEARNNANKLIDILVNNKEFIDTLDRMLARKMDKKQLKTDIKNLFPDKKLMDSYINYCRLNIVIYDIIWIVFLYYKLEYKLLDRFTSETSLTLSLVNFDYFNKNKKPCDLKFSKACGYIKNYSNFESGLESRYCGSNDVALPKFTDILQSVTLRFLYRLEKCIDSNLTKEETNRIFNAFYNEVVRRQIVSSTEVKKHHAKLMALFYKSQSLFGCDVINPFFDSKLMFLEPMDACVDSSHVPEMVESRVKSGEFRSGTSLLYANGVFSLDIDVHSETVRGLYTFAKSSFNGEDLALDVKTKGIFNSYANKYEKKVQENDIKLLSFNSYEEAENFANKSGNLEGIIDDAISYTITGRYMRLCLSRLLIYTEFLNKFIDVYQKEVSLNNVNSLLSKYNFGDFEIRKSENSTSNYVIISKDPNKKAPPFISNLVKGINALRVNCVNKILGHEDKKIENIGKSQNVLYAEIQQQQLIRKLQQLQESLANIEGTAGQTSYFEKLLKVNPEYVSNKLKNISCIKSYYISDDLKNISVKIDSKENLDMASFTDRLGFKRRINSCIMTIENFFNRETQGSFREAKYANIELGYAYTNNVSNTTRASYPVAPHVKHFVCYGTFMPYLIEAYNDSDIVRLISILMEHMTSVNLGDGWGISNDVFRFFELVNPITSIDDMINILESKTPKDPTFFKPIFEHDFRFAKFDPKKIAFGGSHVIDFVKDSSNVFCAEKCFSRINIFNALYPDAYYKDLSDKLSAASITINDFVREFVIDVLKKYKDEFKMVFLEESRDYRVPIENFKSFIKETCDVNAFNKALSEDKDGKVGFDKIYEKILLKKTQEDQLIYYSPVYATLLLDNFLSVELNGIKIGFDLCVGEFTKSGSLFNFPYFFKLSRNTDMDTLKKIAEEDKKSSFESSFCSQVKKKVLSSIRSKIKEYTKNKYGIN